MFIDFLRSRVCLIAHLDFGKWSLSWCFSCADDRGRFKNKAISAGSKWSMRYLPFCMIPRARWKLKGPGHSFSLRLNGGLFNVVCFKCYGRIFVGDIFVALSLHTVSLDPLTVYYGENCHLNLLDINECCPINDSLFYLCWVFASRRGEERGEDVFL